MQLTKKLLVPLSALCASVSADAVSPMTTAEFQIEDPWTHKMTPTLQARLDQRVCLSVHARLVPDGAHTVRLTIYDGLGNEVHKIISRWVVPGEIRGGLLCHGFDVDHDAPGTWWYVVELDDQPLISTSIEIRP